MRGSKKVTSENAEKTFDALAKYGEDLVKRAEDGKIDPVIGRDEEIRRVVRVLSRRTKNNPILVGPPVRLVWVARRASTPPTSRVHAGSWKNCNRRGFGATNRPW